MLGYLRCETWVVVFVYPYPYNVIYYIYMRVCIVCKHHNVLYTM